MSVKRLLGLALLGAGLSTNIARAESIDVQRIQVYAWSGAVPGHGDVGYVAVTNSTTQYVYLKVWRKLRNPPEHIDANGEAACEGANTLGLCAFEKEDEFLVAPDVCTRVAPGAQHFDCLPDANIPADDCCDNGTTCSDTHTTMVCSGDGKTRCELPAPGADPPTSLCPVVGGTCIEDKVCDGHPEIICTADEQCPPVCPPPGEICQPPKCIRDQFCPAWTTVEVRLIKHGPTATGPWEFDGRYGTPVCALYQGTYPNDVPDVDTSPTEFFLGAPTCGHSSWCDTHEVRNPCGFPNGATCSGNGQCLSDFCADGVCCNSVCDGSCRACSNEKTGTSDGVCNDVKAGTDPDNECPGSNTCPCLVE